MHHSKSHQYPDATILGGIALLRHEQGLSSWRVCEFSKCLPNALQMQMDCNLLIPPNHLAMLHLAAGKTPLGSSIAAA